MPVAELPYPSEPGGGPAAQGHRAVSWAAGACCAAQDAITRGQVPAGRCQLQFEQAGDFFNEVPGGALFRKDDTELRDAYNEVLAEIVGDEERYLEIVGEFGFTAEERPTGDLTTEQLCAGDI